MFRLFHALCDRAEGKAPSTQRETPAVEQLLADNIRLTSEVKRLAECYNDLANKVSVLDAGRFHEHSVGCLASLDAQEKSRAQFELWASKDQGYSKECYEQRIGGGYAMPELQRMWRAWQAARRTR